MIYITKVACPLAHVFVGQRSRAMLRLSRRLLHNQFVICLGQRRRTLRWISTSENMSDGLTAVVTGSSGFIASELVKQLLEKGYHVIATHRAADDDDPKVGHLRNLANALPGTLELFSADLLKEGAFDEAVKKADYVFHTASPFFMKVEDPQRDLVTPALEGTRNVMNSVARVGKGVRRVVVTSSLAAIRSKDPGPGGVWTEECWNDWSTLEDNPYMLSKTLAERAAWEIAKAEKLDLVTINPSFVVGPIISRRLDATSILSFKDLVEGKTKSTFPRVVDVRDVARAHILAAETPGASGRFLVSWETTISGKFALDVLREAFPHYDFPEGEDVPSKKEISCDKVVKELGLNLRPPAESLRDMARTLIALNLATPQQLVGTA